MVNSELVIFAKVCAAKILNESHCSSSYVFGNSPLGVVIAFYKKHGDIMLPVFYLVLGGLPLPSFVKKRLRLSM